MEETWWSLRVGQMKLNSILLTLTLVYFIGGCSRVTRQNECTDTPYTETVSSKPLASESRKAVAEAIGTSARRRMLTKVEVSNSYDMPWSRILGTRRCAKVETTIGKISVTRYYELHFGTGERYQTLFVRGKDCENPDKIKYYSPFPEAITYQKRWLTLLRNTMTAQ